MSTRIEQLLELHFILWGNAFKAHKAREIASTTLIELSEMDSAQHVKRGQHLKVTQAQDGWRLSWWEATPTAWQASSMYDTLTSFLILELHKKDYLN